MIRDNQPCVSVVMSVYNGERFVEEAVRSILGQTLENFEFIIINDGSADRSPEILERLATQDARIRLVHQENQGLIASLNRGCNLASGTYIARIDADDVALPDRLEVQVDYLDRHLQVAVVGSTANIIDESGTVIGAWKPPTGSGYIRWRLLFSNCMIHPTVMMRKDVFDQTRGYAPYALHAEDYDLWANISRLHDIENIEKPLLLRRSWDQQITKVRLGRMRQTVCEVSRMQLEYLLSRKIGTDVAADLMALEDRLRNRNDSNMSANGVGIATTLLLDAYDRFVKSNRLSVEDISKIEQHLHKRMKLLIGISGGKSKRMLLGVLKRCIVYQPSIVLDYVVHGLRRRLM